MSNAHTPGPWRYQSNGKRRYNVVHDWQRGGIGESIAQQILRVDDARLIAATLDMAKALKLAETMLSEYCEDYKKIARAALAKAGVE